MAPADSSLDAFERRGSGSKPSQSRPRCRELPRPTAGIGVSYLLPCLEQLSRSLLLGPHEATAPSCVGIARCAITESGDSDGGVSAWCQWVWGRSRGALGIRRGREQGRGDGHCSPGRGRPGAGGPVRPGGGERASADPRPPPARPARLLGHPPPLHGHPAALQCGHHGAGAGVHARDGRAPAGGSLRPHGLLHGQVHPAGEWG